MLGRGEGDGDGEEDCEVDGDGVGVGVESVTSSQTCVLVTAPFGLVMVIVVTQESGELQRQGDLPLPLTKVRDSLPEQTGGSVGEAVGVLVDVLLGEEEAVTEAEGVGVLLVEPDGDEEGWVVATVDAAARRTGVLSFPLFCSAGIPWIAKATKTPFLLKRPVILAALLPKIAALSISVGGV